MNTIRSNNINEDRVKIVDMLLLFRHLGLFGDTPFNVNLLNSIRYILLGVYVYADGYEINI